MKPRVTGLIVTLAFAVFMGTLGADAQQAPKVPRIGYLVSSSFLDGFFVAVTRFGLQELGYWEGRNIAIESRSAGGRDDQLPDLAAELVRLNVDLIIADGTPAVLAAKQATRRIPIVMAVTVDPVEAGLVASLARPGGNVTGVTTLASELSGKRLELLKEVVPKVSRVAVLWNSASREKVFEFRETQLAVQALRLQVQSVEVRRPGDLPGAFERIARERAGALIVLDDSLTSSFAKEITDFAAKNRLPAMYGGRRFMVLGSEGLMFYGPSVIDLARRVAAYADKILKGAKPADLPVEQPTTFELVINLKTAKALGLTIPQSVLVRADKVIQ